MAEETEVTAEETDEFGKWLDELADDDEPSDAEVKAEHEDSKALKVAQQTKKVVTEFITEQKVDDMTEKFLATASDTAKELFAIYRTGDEDPKQLKRIMDLAMTKAAETEKPEPEVDEEVVEAKAAQMAKDAYGVGPIAGGRASTPDDEWASARARVRRGDTHTAFAMFESLPGNGEVTVPD